MRARHRVTGLWMVAATISLVLSPTAVASSPPLTAATLAPTAPAAPSVAAPGLVGTFYPGDGSRILDTR